MIIFLCTILASEALFPGLDRADLSHLSRLVSHFQKHRIESSRLTFVEFLKLHYGDADHLTTTPSEHQDLPFSKRLHHRVSLQIIQELALINPESTWIVLTKLAGPNENIIHPGAVISQVWQPPRA